MEKMVYLVTYNNEPLCWAHSWEFANQLLQQVGYSFIWAPISLCENNGYPHIGDILLGV